MNLAVEIRDQVHALLLVPRAHAEPLQHLVPHRAFVRPGDRIAEHRRHVFSGENLGHRAVAAHRLGHCVGHAVGQLLHGVNDLAQQRARRAGIEAANRKVLGRHLQRHLLGVEGGVLRGGKLLGRSRAQDRALLIGQLRRIERHQDAQVGADLAIGEGVGQRAHRCLKVLVQLLGQRLKEGVGRLMEGRADVGRLRIGEIGHGDGHHLVLHQHGATRVADRLQIAREILLEEGDVEALSLQQGEGAQHLCAGHSLVSAIGPSLAEGALERLHIHAEQPQRNSGIKLSRATNRRIGEPLHAKRLGLVDGV